MARNNSSQQARMSELRRELGVFSASLLVVGGIIGSGIFFTPAETARALPTAGWVLGVWTLGGIVAPVAMGFAGYLERFVPIDVVGGRIGVAAITIIALTITNYLGVKPGTRSEEHTSE